MANKVIDNLLKYNNILYIEDFSFTYLPAAWGVLYTNVANGWSIYSNNIPGAGSGAIIPQFDGNYFTGGCGQANSMFGKIYKSLSNYNINSSNNGFELEIKYRSSTSINAYEGNNTFEISLFGDNTLTSWTYNAHSAQNINFGGIALSFYHDENTSTYSLKLLINGSIVATQTGTLDNANEWQYIYLKKNSNSTIIYYGINTTGIKQYQYNYTASSFTENSTNLIIGGLEQSDSSATHQYQLDYLKIVRR